MSNVPDRFLLPFKERMADRLHFDVINCATTISSALPFISEVRLTPARSGFRRTAQKRQDLHAHLRRPSVLPASNPHRPRDSLGQAAEGRSRRSGRRSLVNVEEYCARITSVACPRRTRPVSMPCPSGPDEDAHAVPGGAPGGRSSSRRARPGDSDHASRAQIIAASRTTGGPTPQHLEAPGGIGTPFWPGYSQPDTKAG